MKKSALAAMAMAGPMGFGGGGGPRRKYKQNGEHLHLKESARRRKQMAKIAARQVN